MTNFYKRIRKLWTYQYIFWVESSASDVKAKYSGERKCYEREIIVWIPFWLKDHYKIDSYYRMVKNYEWINP